MAKIVSYSFKQFVDQFPEIELPITLSEESQSHFSKTNKPIPDQMVHQYLEPLQKVEIDEWTEFQPCFRIPETEKFYGLVYWRAGLLTYEYILATFTKKGVLIDQQVIGGTKVSDGLIARTVATIDDEWNIYVVGGVEKADNTEFDPTKSEAMQLTVSEIGQILVEQ